MWAALRPKSEKPELYIPDDPDAQRSSRPKPSVPERRPDLPSKPLEDLPFDEAFIRENTSKRNPYLEAREAAELELKEYKAARAQLGDEIREICKPEVDAYFDCCVGRVFTIFQCKPVALKMQRCIRKMETPEYVERRLKEIMVERERTGDSIINNGGGVTRERRALYNMAVAPKAEDAADLFVKKDIKPWAV
mmetsp:Transcript_74993/g.139943  ORF Transcript_74993/g.139943 Transcript_74993/m.139943 type:complete len:193 (-) Transcript_74993:136-714(-)